MDNAQQKALQKYADNLAQLITRLAAFYEGTNSKVDQEIKVLKGHLAGKPDFTLAAVSIQKLNPLLMDGNLHVRHQIKEKVSLLQTRIKAVQQLDGTTTEFRRSIAQILSSLSLPTPSLDELFGHFFNVTELLESATQDNSTANEAQTVSDQPSVAALNDAARAQTQEELKQCVEVFARKKPDDIQIAELKTLFEKGVDEQQLLESCLVLIRVIINETMLDASMNGKVLQNIYNALTQTDEKVTQSISLSKQMHEKNTTQHEQIQGLLGEFDTDVNEQNNVEALKDKAHQYISRIRNELSDKHIVDNQEQEKLMGLLVDMQSQLSSLQQQTQNYKKRLVEQRASLYTDPLTRVPNRLAYNERAAKAVNFAQAQNEPLSLAVIDVDHFKSINDKYGHAAGDRTLQVIARHLKKNLQPNEFLARWGGEEFALLMQNQANATLKQRLDVLREGLSELPFKFKQTPVKITASFGACSYRKGESLHIFFERADSALYQAKKNGRNRVELNEMMD